jgi:hypothetical protein
MQHRLCIEINPIKKKEAKHKFKQETTQEEFVLKLLKYNMRFLNLSSKAIIYTNKT